MKSDGMLAMNQAVWQGKEAQRPSQHSEQSVNEASQDFVFLGGVGGICEHIQQCSGREVHKIWGMRFFIAVGVASVCVCVVLDTLVRLRLRDAGERAVFWQGGTLDYGKYLRLRKQKGWSPWPVYLIAPFLLVGVGLIILSLFRA
jgi:hypothetical protein